MTEETLYKSDGSLRYKTIYKYDDKGNWTEWTEYAGEAMIPTKGGVQEIVYRNN